MSTSPTPSSESPDQCPLTDLEKLTRYLSGKADEQIRLEIGQRLLVKGGDLLEVMNSMSRQCDQLMAKGEDCGTGCFQGMSQEEFDRLSSCEEEYPGPC